MKLAQKLPYARTLVDISRRVSFFISLGDITVRLKLTVSNANRKTNLVTALLCRRSKVKPLTGVSAIEHHIRHRRGLHIFFSLPDSFRFTIAPRNQSVYLFLSFLLPHPSPSLSLILPRVLFLSEKRLSIYLSTESLFLSSSSRQESKFAVATPPSPFMYRYTPIKAHTEIRD